MGPIITRARRDWAQILRVVMVAAATLPLKVRVALSVCVSDGPTLAGRVHARGCAHVGDHAALVCTRRILFLLAMANRKRMRWVRPIRPGAGGRATRPRLRVYGVYACAPLSPLTNTLVCLRRRWACSSRKKTRRPRAERVGTHRQILQLPGAHRATTFKRGTTTIQSLQQALRP